MGTYRKINLHLRKIIIYFFNFAAKVLPTLIL